MTPGQSVWQETFEYLDGKAVVSRLERGWRLRMNGTTVRAPTLNEAFESLGKRVGDDELAVVLAALTWDNAFRSMRSEH
jgi:hypothetical protein